MEEGCSVRAEVSDSTAAGYISCRTERGPVAAEPGPFHEDGMLHIYAPLHTNINARLILSFNVTAGRTG